MLRDAQDDAVVLLLRLRVVMIVVAVSLAVGVLVSRNTGRALLGGRRKLLEEMMHPMRRGGGEKKAKGRSHAHKQAASNRKGCSSSYHEVRE